MTDEERSEIEWEEENEKFMCMGDDEAAEIAYYHSRETREVNKLCIVCSEIRSMQPEYNKCDSCMDDIENGRDPIGA